jgi:hypothetical protein
MNDLVRIIVLDNYLGNRLTQCFASIRMANCSYVYLALTLYETQAIGYAMLDTRGRM